MEIEVIVEAEDRHDGVRIRYGTAFVTTGKLLDSPLRRPSSHKSTLVASDTSAGTFHTRDVL